MSSDYTTRLVRDSRLNDISKSVEVAVSQGAAQSTFQQFPANSASSSSISFNVIPPNENVIIDRNVLITTKVKFSISIGAGVPVGVNVWQYGKREAFAPFPLNSMFTTSQVTINNASVSVPTQDILGPLLHLMDKQDLAKCKGMTPYMLDSYYNYSDGVNASNNSLSSFENADFNQHLLPRGCHPLDSVVIAHAPSGGDADDSPVSTNVLDTWVITVEATFTEPLFLSPFLFHSRYNEAGLLGVNSINFVFNIDSQLKRFWSTGLAAGPEYKLALDQNKPFSDTKLHFNILTTQPTYLVDARNSIPFCDYSRFSTTAANTDTIAPNSKKEVITNSIQLSKIPDKIILVCRKQLSAQTARDSLSFFKINTVTCDFNASSGLLSNCKAQDLWRLSVVNGSKQNWYEYSGKAQVYNAPGTSSTQISTCGSVLVIDPSRDLSLAPYLSNNSLGQFNMSFSLSVTNISSETIAPEVLVITSYAGVFTTNSGSSTRMTGLLNKELVVSAATEGNALSSNEYNQMSGGALSDQVASALKNMPIMKKHVGAARSAGSYVGSARSAGQLSKNKLDSLVM